MFEFVVVDDDADTDDEGAGLVDRNRDDLYSGRRLRLRPATVDADRASLLNPNPAL